MLEWEEIAEGTWRLELESGWLYRVGSSVVYVPPDNISQGLYDLSETLSELKLLFHETTFEAEGSGIETGRTIRTCDIGRE